MRSEWARFNKHIKKVKAKKKMCVNKKRFVLEKDAIIFASTQHMRVYRCPHCEGYHCTSDGKYKQLQKDLRELKREQWR